MAVLQIILLILGFVLLVKGADFFVDGASGIAQKLKVSTFIIGLTVVAVGTSCPEAAVSIIGAASGEGDVIVGNVIGSNTMNILLILGLASLLTRIPVEDSSRRVELPFLLTISVIFLLFGIYQDNFTWWEGLILFALYILFMAYTVWMARTQKSGAMEEAISSTATADDFAISSDMSLWQKLGCWYQQYKQKTWFLVVITLIGLAMVVGGAELVVKSASYIAEVLLHIPSMVVGLTVVAFGTSLPELVTSITAAKKGDMGLATGNIIGSNIANLLFVGGIGFICSGSQAIAVDVNTFLIDIFVSILACLILWLFSFSQKRSLGRTAGVVMLGTLVIYYVYLFLMAFGVIVL